ncbi:MAG: TrmH family RNA methyltransferase [Ignavibacterium sp.]|nr:MAG: RNA methyltransferase [Ignavibacterium sp.]MDD5609706.1 TrmH family RNA methyltransferase [Ignavibacterium sp.]MDX9712019.1 TrmH family RNA methyltransferase [Ignavibacteriaceae bacterium]MEB2354163.1 RNA methyltransferase [Ignavibacteriales bacterium]GIK23194.1 MAG: tRNA (guanosine(18)-2'-O)-methyltransferase [Ignavibacteriota bacterium]
MRNNKTEKRIEKITRVIKSRQHSLTVVLENIHDPHNVSAIFRTCDAVGIPKVNLIYNFETFPKIGKKSSASAFKWVEKEKFKTVDKCYSELHNNGFKIYASSLTEHSKKLYELDLTKKAAIVVGNEHRGVSEEAAKYADDVFLIPQFGMVQSLNVSVAAAVILYEAMRQRLNKGMYKKSELDNAALEKIIDEWCAK